MGREAVKITFLVQTEGAIEVVHGSEFSLNGKDYLVVGKQPIDDGKLSLLILKEVD